MLSRTRRNGGQHDQPLPPPPPFDRPPECPARNARAMPTSPATTSARINHRLTVPGCIVCGRSRSATVGSSYASRRCRRRRPFSANPAAPVSSPGSRPGFPVDASTSAWCPACPNATPFRSVWLISIIGLSHQETAVKVIFVSILSRLELRLPNSGTVGDRLPRCVVIRSRTQPSLIRT